MNQFMSFKINISGNVASEIFGHYETLCVAEAVLGNRWVQHKNFGNRGLMKPTKTSA